MKSFFYLIFVSLLLVSCSQPTLISSIPSGTAASVPLPASTPSPISAPITSSNITLTPTEPAAPTATPLPNEATLEAGPCGPWSSQAGPLGAAISQKYGELRNCLFFDNAWIITTLGLKGKNGAVAVYRCAPADAACLDSQADHPLSGWRFYEPAFPCPGGFSVVSKDHSTGKIEMLGGCRIWFDVASGTFSEAP